MRIQKLGTGMEQETRSLCGLVRQSSLPPATKLGQGYVFTRVCDSGVGCLVPGGAWGLGGLLPGGVCVWRPSLLWRLLLRAIRILLECILVSLNFTRLGMCGHCPPVASYWWSSNRYWHMIPWSQINFSTWPETILTYSYFIVKWK